MINHQIGKTSLVCLTRPRFRNYTIGAFIAGMVSGASIYHLLILLGVLS